MNLDELNKQMFALQNEFKINAQTESNINAINFQEVKSPIETTQIKRPNKSGDHRNDINDKLNSINTFQYLPQDIMQKPPNTMPSFTRNYSNAQPQQMSQQQTNFISTRAPEVTNSSNHLSSYYNHNFDTLQNHQKPLQTQVPLSFLDDNAFNNNSQDKSLSAQSSSQSSGQSSAQSSSHSSGLQMLNPRNMYSMGNYEEVPNKYNESGYHKVEEKKIDYRQNMNNKLDTFIFDNPNAVEINPILQQAQMQKQYGQTKDTRMVIQDSSKDFYRQSANDRMSQYSPLSRASHMPISMANMSVNDFYSNMQGNSIPHSNKDEMNSRIDNYTPLAKTMQYQKQNVDNNVQLPPKFTPIDNINGKLNNVVFKDLPVMSNTISNSMKK